MTLISSLFVTRFIFLFFLSKERKINNIIALIVLLVIASLVVRYFVFIHPYMDGNGRTARFIMNVMLVTAGYCEMRV